MCLLEIKPTQKTYEVKHRQTDRVYRETVLKYPPVINKDEIHDIK